MDDLIKRQDAIDAINQWIEMDKYYHPYSKGKTILAEEAIDEIQRLPSAEPVIRCKDCEHDGYCRRLSSRTPDDYCSHAKRRIDD